MGRCTPEPRVHLLRSTPPCICRGCRDVMPPSEYSVSHELTQPGIAPGIYERCKSSSCCARNARGEAARESTRVPLSDPLVERDTMNCVVCCCSRAICIIQKAWKIALLNRDRGPEVRLLRTVQVHPRGEANLSTAAFSMKRASALGCCR